MEHNTMLYFCIFCLEEPMAKIYTEELMN